MASKPKKLAAESDIDAEVDEAEGETSRRGRKLPLRLILMVAAGVLVLGGGGGVAWFMKAKAKEAQAAAAPVVKPAVYLDMPDVLVNLANTGTDRSQYLKVKITLEMTDQIMVQQVQPVMPRVMDAFQTYLRELRPADLEGSAGLYRMKEELTRRVNAAISPNRVNAVLFKEIVVQ